jgi:hypothetical protein
VCKLTQIFDCPRRWQDSKGDKVGAFQKLQVLQVLHGNKVLQVLQVLHGNKVHGNKVLQELQELQELQGNKVGRLQVTLYI